LGVNFGLINEAKRLGSRSDRTETLGNLRYSEWPIDLERARLWYEPHLDRIHEDADTRRADLLQLEQNAFGYSSRERFLTPFTLDLPDATNDEASVPPLDEDDLILYTIHSAKGQEWSRSIAQCRRRLHALRSRNRHLG